MKWKNNHQKKKKKKKKKKTNTLPDTPGKDYDKAARNHQSNPPSIPVKPFYLFENNFIY